MPNQFKKILNYAGGKGKIEVAFNKDDNEPAEILICEDIGKDPWTGEGITAKDINAALKEISPRGRPLNFLTNSPGGSVSEGVAIRNILNEWPGRITNTIIGVAASTASWCIPADETRAYKSSQMFIHRCWGMVVGNADDLRDAIEFLETTDKQIAQIYADETGEDEDEMMDLMSNETLLTGQEAKDLGLVDVIIDGEAKNNFTTEAINAMKLKLAALNKLKLSAPTQGADNPPTKDIIMNKEKMIALLNKWGVQIPKDATDEQLLELIENYKPATSTAPAAPAPANAAPGDAAPTKAELEALRQQISQLTTANSEANRIRMTEYINRLITEDKLQANLRDAAIEDVIKNPDRVANFYDKLEPKPVGATPVGPGAAVEIVGNSFKEVQEGILKNGPLFRRQFLGNRANGPIGDHACREMGERAVVVANAIKKNKGMLIERFNSNAIDTDLQRQVILQDMLEAYAIILQALDAFSVVYKNVPLEGSDSVVVPYFPLQTTASTQFVAGTGFTTISDWTENSRKVTIGGDGNAATSGANATAGTAKDRLYQAINFTSYDMSRQPYLNIMKLAQQAGNKLAVDVFTQIVSRVVVTGNFGAAVKTVAAALFAPDDVADLSEYADSAFWPTLGRSLTLTNTYKTPLLKDPTFKQYLSYGSTDPIRKAMIQEAYGFENMYFIPGMTAFTAANVSGWINHKSAVLCAFAPVMPTPEVRNLLTTFDLATDPQSGITLAYRKFGNATTDATTEAIDSCFGAAKGVDAALKIIKSA